MQHALIPPLRAVIRVHKEALTLQNELWRTCLKSTVSVTDVDKALDALEVATGRANQVYKRYGSEL